VATEAGYHNAIDATVGQPGIDEQTVADYLPRLFLSAFAEGIRRTYWYELVDLAGDPERTHPDANFGLLRSDFSPKPAFTALANLMRLAGGGQRRPGRALDLSISAPDDVRRLLLYKADGVYLLALWRPLTLYETGARRAVEAPPVEVRVAMPDRAAAIDVHRPSRSPRPVRRLRATDRVSVSLAGDAVILALTLGDDDEPAGEAR
jgi:hypothetical protein